MLLCTTLLAQEKEVIKETHTFAIKQSDTLMFDRYYTQSSISSSEPSAAIVFLFGGAFYTGTRNNREYIAAFEHYAKEGYQVISIDYRLGLKDFDPNSISKLHELSALMYKTIDLAVADLFDATTFIYDRGAEWNIDTDKIITLGSSAGAISVLQAEYYLTNGGHALIEKLPEGFRYAGVMAMAGAIFSDSGKIKWEGEPSPILLLQGDADRNVPYDKVRIFRYGMWGSAQIAKSLSKIYAPYYFYTFYNTDHSIAVSPLDDNREDIDAFISKLALGGQRIEIIKSEVATPFEGKVKKKLKMKDFLNSNFSH